MCRLVSYNIHSGIGRDKKCDFQRIGQFLANSGADIVLLQEMDTRPPERNTEKDINDICANNTYQLVSSPTITETEGWYGNAVLTRFDIISRVTIDVSQQGRQPRNIQVVELKTEKGPLTVVNTHMGLKKRERRTQLSLLYDYLVDRLISKKTPLVLAGDFNEWQFFSRAFGKLNKLLEQQRVGATFPIFSLDRVWVTRDIDVKQYIKIKHTKTKILSDHLPILLDITM